MAIGPKTPGYPGHHYSFDPLNIFECLHTTGFRWQDF
jgi:hypothetical protein